MIERINLVPKKSSAKKNWAVFYALTGVFFLSSTLILVFLYTSTATKINKIDTLMKQSILHQDSVVNLQGKVTQLKQSVNRNKEKINQLSTGAIKFNQIRSEKQQYSKVLNAIAGNLPESVTCKSIEISNSSGTITGIAMFYSELPEFVDKLRNLKEIYSSVTLQSIGTNTPSDNTAPYNFTIVFSLQQLKAS